jgi:hypothetical protein
MAISNSYVKLPEGTPILGVPCQNGNHEKSVERPWARFETGAQEPVATGGKTAELPHDRIFLQFLQVCFQQNSRNKRKAAESSAGDGLPLTTYIPGIVICLLFHIEHLAPNYWIMGNQMAYHGHTVSTNKLCISKIYHQMFIPTISVAAWIFSSSQPLRVLPLRVSVASLLDLTWGIGYLMVGLMVILFIRIWKINCKWRFIAGNMNYEW